MLGRVSTFFAELSLVELAEYSRPTAWVLRFLRILYYIFDEFLKDRCLQAAASLAYTTLLSLVPIAAISLAVLSRFRFSQEGVQNLLMKYLLPTASFQEIIMENIAKFAANTAALSILGGLFLAVMAVVLLNTVEGSFNAIWRVTERRSLLSKFTAFWSVITFAPILLGASLVLTSRFYKARFVGDLLEHELIGSAVGYVLPFLLIFGVIFFSYRVLPYTKVRAFPAVMGAFVATVLFSYARWWFGVYVTTYANFEKIYGMLGTLPAFLIWIYVSWVILLFGSEVTFTIQYHRLDPKEKRVSLEDPTCSPYYGVRLVLALQDHFRQGKGPLSAAELSNRLNVRQEVVEEILSRLDGRHITASVDDAKERFLPARDLDRITLKEIVEPLQRGSLATPSWPRDRQREVIEGIFRGARGAVDEVLGRITIKDVQEKLSGEDQSG